MSRPLCGFIPSYVPSDIDHYSLRRIVEGEWTDEDIADPLSSMFAFLTEKRDRKLTQQWGIWLTKRDPERALKVSSEQSTGVLILLMAYASC
jgi:hypothetical protein